MPVRCTSRPVRFEHSGRDWTASELERLRRARFRPAAWRCFVARSFARADEQRAARAQAHREVVAAGVLGLAACAAAALAGAPLPALVAAAWWAAVMLMLDWHLGLLERPGGRPLDGLGPANWLTLARAAFVPVLLFVQPGVLAVLYASARATDVADGYAARTRGEVTRLGAWLDGSVDAALLAVAVSAALAHGAISAPAAAAALARALLPSLGIAVVAFARASVPPLRRLPAAAAASAALDVGLVLALLGVAAGSTVVLAAVAWGLAAALTRLRRRHQPSGSSS